MMPMTPIRLNRRRFLGASAAAGLALSQGVAPADTDAGGPPRPVRLGLIGAGSRGTALTRALLELPGARFTAVCDTEPRHARRAQGIIEKATGDRPDASDSTADLLAREDVEAVIVALPCDLHAATYRMALAAGKHLYAEKPLGLTLDECDAVIAAAASRPELAVHVGHQRRSNPRVRAAVDVARRGDLGTLLSARGRWISSNGPISGHDGWLGRRERSGDWMIEQACHVWDVLAWAAGGPPAWATGSGQRDVFAAIDPNRDVTDHYSVLLSWPGGLHATFTQSWVDPADDAFTGADLQLVGTAGGLDLTRGVATFRDRARPRLVLPATDGSDTKLALAAFLAAVRAPEPTPPPLTLEEARLATQVGLLVREAIDLGPSRIVRLEDLGRI
jgi:predicted dehydrogenase